MAQKPDDSFGRLQPPRGFAATAGGATIGSNGDRRQSAPGVLPALPRQRRRRMLVLALVLVGAGAALAGYLSTGLSERTSAVVITRNVPVGQQLTGADVATSSVAVDQKVATIPGRQLRQVIGRVAAVDLRAGSLLTPAEVTNALSPRPGQQVVPVAVHLAQLPARGLQPGDQVLIIATPGSQGQSDTAGQDAATALASDTPATVDQVSPPDADGMVRVDVVVDARVGPAIAKQASTGRIGFVLTSRGAS